MAPKKAPQAPPPAANNNLDLASQCDENAFKSCIYCEEEIDRDYQEYVVNLCSHCGAYPVHKECLEEYLETGRGDYKVSTNTQKKGMREAMIRRHPASQAKGRRCGKGRYGETEEKFTDCQGTVVDTQLYDQKHKHKAAAKTPANLANTVIQQVRQERQAKQAGQQAEKQKPAAKGKAGAGANGGAAGPTIGVLNKVGVQPKGKDKDGADSMVSSTTGGGQGANFGGETMDHDFKMTGIEAELAVYHGFIKDKNFKAKLCPLEQSPGACRFGDLCSDAHTVEELRIDEAIKLGHVDPLYKCKICMIFAVSGQCANGLYCPDAHSVKERRTALAVLHGVEQKDYKTSYCSTAGTEEPCPEGLRCRKAHSIEEHRRDAAWLANGVTTVENSAYKTKACIQFYMEGKCKDGFKCDFAHGPKDLRVIAALEGGHLRRTYKTQPCEKGMACTQPWQCWFYHNEDDHMSPYFMSQRRLCPSKQEIGICSLNDRPGLSCPFAHEVFELDIVDYIERKVKRREQAKAAAQGANDPKPVPTGTFVPRSVLEGKLPVKESQELNRNAVKRQNKRRNKGLKLDLVLEGKEGEEDDAIGTPHEAATAEAPWNVGAEAFPQLPGFTPPTEGAAFGGLAAAQAETLWVVPQDLMDLMRQYKLALCNQTLKDMGFDADKAWVITKYAGGDLEIASGLLADLGPHCDVRQYDRASPIHVELELQELLLAAGEWGLAHQDVVDVLRVRGGDYDKAKLSLEVRARALASGDWRQGYHDDAPVVRKPPAQSQAPTALPPAPPPPARPSLKDRPEDKGFAPPSRNYIAPLPFPTYDTNLHLPSTSAAQPTTVPALPAPTPTPTTAAVAPVPAISQMPMTTKATAPAPAAVATVPAATHMQTSRTGTATTAAAPAQNFYAEVEPEPAPAYALAEPAAEVDEQSQYAWPAEGQEAYYEEEVPQYPVKQRQWWPENAFLGFNPNARLPLSPVGAPPQVALPPAQPPYIFSSAANPRAAYPHPLGPDPRPGTAPPPVAAPRPAVVPRHYVTRQGNPVSPHQAQNAALEYAPPPPAAAPEDEDSDDDEDDEARLAAMMANLL